MRIGHGYDVHRFCAGEKIVLGGVYIGYAMGFKAHSDGDVLIHAIMDALLGAATLGDIGLHFPDTDNQYENISSIILLKKVKRIIGYEIINIDCTIIAEEPKLSGYIMDMRKNIADALSMELESINIKATTEEGLGFTGRKQGIAAHAVCLLK